MWPPSPADVEAAIVPLADATSPACGGKARNLAKLMAAGLPVPEGFVVDDSLFRACYGRIDAVDPALAEAALERIDDELLAAPPVALEAVLVARAAPLGELVFRSSASNEDGEFRVAAGIYDSTSAFEPARAWEGCHFVWASATGFVPLKYALLAGEHGALPPFRDLLAPVAVIVQRFVHGAKVIVYTRRPGRPTDDEVLVQHADHLAPTTRSATDPIVALALRAEAAIGATQGADVELVVGDDGVISVVQARTIIHPTTTAWVEPPPMATRELVGLGGVWTWDVAHNPDPLSVVQASLVYAVSDANVAPYELRSCVGFLYTSPRASVALPYEATALRYAAVTLDPERVAVVLAEIETRLAAALTAVPAELPDARPAADALGLVFAQYLAFYKIWAWELSPLVAAVKRATLHAPGEARPSSVEATLLAAARGEIDEATVLARIGRLAPAWDVATPTYAERPAVIREAIARAKLVTAAPREATVGAADLAERDDHWFAEAQWVVRRAFLAYAHERGVDPDDVFWLPNILLGDDLAPEVAKRRAAGARAAAARAARWKMPLVVGGDRTEVASEDLRGVGSGGRAQGRVVKFATLASAVAVGSGDVIVTRAVTPALAVLVIGCAALVSETGGLLDHGAAMARELGIPCVVGCRDAWTSLEDGAIVEVDGDAGRVTVIRHRS